MTIQRIGRYELRDSLGSGGAGVVYRAWDPAQGREVALKVLHPRDGGATAQQRFLTECHALARLDHPNIVRVLEVGEERGRPYLTLQLVEGRSLQERLDREGPLPIVDVTRIARSLALALEHAHAHGIVHRDLKPANVLEGSDRIWLTDFGLARDLESGSRRLTATGQFTGTPGYWSPEQARGQLDRIGPRSDIYGLGATLYALLTGVPPHAGETLADAILAADRRVEPPSRRRDGIPARLEQLILRCLEREPKDRYASSQELAIDLEACLTAARAVPRPVLVGAILMPLAVLGTGLLLLREEAPPVTPSPAAPTLVKATAPPPLAPKPSETPKTSARIDRALAAAEAALTTRDWDRAVKLLADRSDPAARYLRGQVHFDHSSYEQGDRESRRALEALEGIEPTHPLAAPAQAVSALCLRVLGRPWITIAQRAVQSRGDERSHPPLLHVRMHVLNAEHTGGDRRKLDAKLITEYRAGLERVPTDVVCMTGIARAHARRGEFEQAQQVLRRGLDVLPDHPQLHYTLVT